MAGRPPVAKFHSLEIGEVIELRGKQRRHVYQYVYQFNNSKVRSKDGMQLKHYKENGQQFVKRVK